jgi:glycosyltransferase involved in cell wall biosynthesis
MSVYNQEKYLDESILSILNQTFTEFEFLIVDDCSNDGTVDILNYYNNIDTRINLFINHSNQGLSYNLNYLFKEASGRFIARMDADDISHYKRLETQFKIMQENSKIDVLACNSHIININGSIICKKYVPTKFSEVINSLHYHNYFTHPSVVIRQSSMERYGLYNVKYLRGQDWELWQRYASAGANIRITSEYLFFYRLKESYHSNYHFGLICLLNRSKKDATIFFEKMSCIQKLKFKLRAIIPHKLLMFIIKLFQLYYPFSPLNKIKQQGKTRQPPL